LKTSSPPSLIGFMMWQSWFKQRKELSWNFQLTSNKNWVLFDLGLLETIFLGYFLKIIQILIFNYKIMLRVSKLEIFLNAVVRLLFFFLITKFRAINVTCIRKHKIYFSPPCTKFKNITSRKYRCVVELLNFEKAFSNFPDAADNFLKCLKSEHFAIVETERFWSVFNLGLLNVQILSRYQSSTRSSESWISYIIV